MTPSLSSSAEVPAQSISDSLTVFAVLLLACSPLKVSFIPATHGVFFPRKSFSSTHANFVMKERTSTVVTKLEKLFQGALLLQDAFEEHVTGRVLQDSWDKARFSKIAQRVHTAPSSRHGLGLFASHDLEEDTLVTFYPVHKVGAGKESIDLEDDKTYWDSCMSWYQLHIQDGSSNDLFVDCNPHREDVMGWLAHRTNDATRCSGVSEEDILKYHETCARECNAVFWEFGTVRPIMGLVTTRPVQKGEEILVSYSDAYWTRQEGADVGSLKVDLNSFIQGTEYQERAERLNKIYQHEINCFEKLLQEAGLTLDGGVDRQGFGDAQAKDFDTKMREICGFAGGSQKARKRKKKKRNR